MFFCNKSNEGLLKSFLARVLNIPVQNITDLEIVNPELLPREKDDKFGRMDINLKVDDKKVDIEMQFCNEGNYPERTLFYWSKMYSDSLKIGEDYGELPKCICINIINFRLFKCENYHSQFEILETQRYEQLTDRLEIHFFELPKLSDKLDPNDPLKLWMQLINSETRRDLDMLENTNVREIHDAVVVIRKMSEDERAKELSRQRERQINDEYNALSYARKQGMKVGKEEGMAEGIVKGRAEGRAEGIAEGIEKGRAEGIAEGIEKGRAEGIAEGIEKGRAEGKAEGKEEGRVEEKAAIIAKLEAYGMTQEQIKAILSDSE